MGTNRLKALAVVMTLGLFVAGARAETYRVNARENPQEVSAFTLDFGEALGGVASGMIALTDYTLEVDSTNGSARFMDYYQEIEAITLPGGVSTGNIVVTVVDGTSAGTYDTATGRFDTAEDYAVFFEADLSMFGLESPVILSSTSAGAVDLGSIEGGFINFAWTGDGDLANPFDPSQRINFSYTCSVNTVFPVSASMYVGLAIVPDVLNIDLSAGYQNSLLSKLDRSLFALSRNNTTAAANNLFAFAHAVDAQAGKRFSVEDADRLINNALDTIEALGTSTAKSVFTPHGRGPGKGTSR